MARDLAAEGWIMLDDRRIQFYNFTGGGVMPTDYVIALAIRYATSQEHLDRVRSKETQPDQLQVGLNSQQARHLAHLLLAAADHMDAEHPPPDKQN